MSVRISGVWLALLLSAFSLPVSASTLFSINECQEGLFAKNAEWGPRNGYVFYNYKGLEKRAYPRGRFFVEASWTARFASVSFSSLGRQFSEGGINERGLVVESAQFPAGHYSQGSDLARINEFEWVQYLLDTAGDLDEAIERARAVEIQPLGESLHYLVCDRNQLCAVFEYLNGRLVIYSPYADELPVATLTSSAYKSAVNFLREHIGFGGSSRIPEGSSPLERFVQASYYVAEFPRRPNGVTTLDYTWSVLDALGSAKTKWQVVYVNRTDPEVYVKAAHAQAFSGFRLRDLTRPCSAQHYVRRLDLAKLGRESPFIEDNRAYTIALLKHAMSTLRWIRSDSDVAAMADHAFSFRCKPMP